jgi:hypothetical protein
MLLSAAAAVCCCCLLSAAAACCCLLLPAGACCCLLLLLPSPQGTAFADDTAEAHAVPNAGDYHYRANPGAEKHLNDPAAIAALQAAVQVGAYCW